MTKPLDAYEVLQVDPGAKDDAIRAAYRRLARKYHPDLATEPDAALNMAAINAAWELIGKPDARATYDRTQTRPAAKDRRAATPPPGTVSRDWTPGPRPQGDGSDSTMRGPEGLGAAGPSLGRPSGTVLNFGRYSGWSLGEIARYDLDYIEWLDRAPIGRIYREEVDAILRSSGRRGSASTESTERRGLFRRR